MNFPRIIPVFSLLLAFSLGCTHGLTRNQMGEIKDAVREAQREAAEKCMMEDVIKESVSYSESSRNARMGYLTGQIAGRDASISRSLSHHPKKEYIFDPSDFRRLKLHEAIFKGFDLESIIGPAKIFLKPYWKERGVSYFEEESR